MAKDQNDTLPTADKLAAEADELLDGIRAAVEVQRLAKQKAEGRHPAMKNLHN